jgi:uridine kinase
MYLFSIEGNIGSGKSTFIANLKTKLKHWQQWVKYIQTKSQVHYKKHIIIIKSLDLNLPTIDRYRKIIGTL